MLLLFQYSKNSFNSFSRIPPVVNARKFLITFNNNNGYNVKNLCNKSEGSRIPFPVWLYGRYVNKTMKRILSTSLSTDLFWLFLVETTTIQSSIKSNNGFSITFICNVLCYALRDGK